MKKIHQDAVMPTRAWTCGEERWSTWSGRRVRRRFGSFLVLNLIVRKKGMTVFVYCSSVAGI